MDALFVCTGNICRSPIGERICRDIAATRGVNLGASSAGVGALNGQPMHPFAAEVLNENGVDTADFESRYLHPRILQPADLVLCMTREHRAAGQRMLPVRWKRMFTLIEFVELVSILNGDAQREADSAPSIETIMASRGRIDTNSAHLDILDPMGRPKTDFERVYREVEPHVAAVVEWAIHTQDQ
ncbi:MULTISPECIES: arsenate reductase/protein-tyrosine-phosphatase family protein [Gordonia]|uniref:Phosphotyrosine protein phosphatase I domain-containing protein n=1 Tax=Gordonia sputi NBRC 100414 TaxID=1089453 RepID=H5U6C0_9ACTN|nr:MULTISPECIES: protein-tyrosine-phosphatase [Gordonia]NKY92194.1 low molecular weight phosphotyrosine protein phosphatase [Gordonia sputi]OBA73822.1 protein tyrosine phosphatase [Gordonia sp. 852002-10350_SCH5691597]GAB41278.1 putative protein-tyrosine-phosphatase [Gordonia sputi NBRC 100414]